MLGTGEIWVCVTTMLLTNGLFTYMKTTVETVQLYLKSKCVSDREKPQSVSFRCASVAMQSDWLLLLAASFIYSHVPGAAAGSGKYKETETEPHSLKTENTHRGMQTC